VAGYNVFRNSVAIATTSQLTYTDASLSPSTGYSYAVDAYDASGNVSSLSAPLNVTTTAQTATPNFVQVNATTPQSSQSTVTVTYTAAQTAGNTNIVAIGWNDITSNIVSVTDSAGNAYQVAVPTARGNGLSQAIYYAKNIAPSSANGNTVTVTFNTSAAYPDIRIMEYSGLDTVSPFDVGASGSGSGNPALSGSITTTLSNDLLVGAGMTTWLFNGSGSGFTTRNISSPDGDIVEDQVTTTPGNYSASAQTASGSWIMQVAAFKAGS
jgi:chitodextrinase